MRVAYDHQIFGWQEYGGISRYFFELANNLSDAPDTEVAIIAPLHVNSYLASASHRLHVMGRRVPAIRKTGRIYRAINQWLFPPMVADFRPDVLHETYYSAKRVAPKGSRVVLTVFDMIHERFPTGWNLTSREKSLAVKRADHVICISENTRQDLINFFGIDSAKITVIHLGFSLTQTPQQDHEESANGRPYILFVGGRGGYKNFETLVRAYAASSLLLHEYDLVAFGGGPLTRNELKLVHAVGIPQGRVRQISGDDTMLARFYRQAAVFVYPSRYEGFGIPPLEAMSFDCPVACSNTSSIPEVVGNAAELFDPDSVDALRYGVERITENTELRKALILRGRERINLFSWERCALQTRNVYQELM